MKTEMGGGEHILFPSAAFVPSLAGLARNGRKPAESREMWGRYRLFRCHGIRAPTTLFAGAAPHHFQVFQCGKLPPFFPSRRTRAASLP